MMKPQDSSLNVPKMCYAVIPFFKFKSGSRIITNIILVEFPDFKKIRKKKTSEVIIKDGNIIEYKGNGDIYWSDERKRCFYFDGHHYNYNLDCLSLSEGFYDKYVMDDKESALLKFELTEIGEIYNG